MTSPSFLTIRYAPGTLTLLDQTKLPTEETYVELKDLESVALAIETMVVRGAPAIGISAAYGLAIARRTGVDMQQADARLRRTRPTAVNLFWALDRMRPFWADGADAETLEHEADAIYVQDKASSEAMAALGAKLIPDGATVLTHCNAGALATAELGTALAAIRGAHNAGKSIRVLADETRPVLQGARLTAWELMKDGIDVTVIADGAVAHFLGQGVIDCAVTGADRIAANGDAANKIGTRGVACLLHHHQKPMYIAAPWSTVDMTLATGDLIEIEERPAHEVHTIRGQRIVPEGVKVRNPAFDVTPAHWITGLILDRGYVCGDLQQGLRTLAG